MATLAMRHVREGEVPRDGGTAVQEAVDRPVFQGNGPDDYVCVECGNLLATAMPPEYMNPAEPAPTTKPAWLKLLPRRRNGDRRKLNRYGAGAVWFDGGFAEG